MKDKVKDKKAQSLTRLQKALQNIKLSTEDLELIAEFDNYMASINKKDGLVYDFLKEYVLLPQHDQLKKHAQLIKHEIGSGENGIIYESGLFKSQPIITKLTFDDSCIQELFINMVIINDIISTHRLDGFLIPTYGAFLCPATLKKRKTTTATEICEDTQKPRKILFTQQQIDGVTLDQAFRQKKATLKQVRHIMKDIFTVLLMFERSPYGLVHYDLHSGNIMINDEGLWIIDFGLSTFTLHGKRYENFITSNYIGKTKMVHGSMYDIWFLLASLYYLVDDDARDYLRSKKRMIFNLFYRYGHHEPKPVHFDDEYNERRPVYWLYDMLKKMETNAAGGMDRRSHDANVKVLEQYSYSRIKTDFFGDL
jgi:serine/threonine protein kinase